MHTDWFQVAPSLVAVVFGVLLVRNAVSVADLYRAIAKCVYRSDRVIPRHAPILVRIVGCVSVAIGLIGAVLGLFFADEM